MTTPLLRYNLFVLGFACFCFGVGIGMLTQAQIAQWHRQRVEAAPALSEPSRSPKRAPAGSGAQERASGAWVEADGVHFTF